jgi:hypothetical protein
MSEIGPTNPPWPIGGATNAKRVGWAAYFESKARDTCPFPPVRRDLLASYLEGWDAAAEWDLLHGDGAGRPLGILREH